MDKIKALLLLAVWICLAPLSSVYAAVWSTESQWDESWENRYRQWVVQNWKDDIFMNPAKPIYYKFENDCADATYMMRLIFSFEHRLPFAVNNQQSPGKVISNEMSTWDNLPEPQRVRSRPPDGGRRAGLRGGREARRRAPAGEPSDHRSPGALASTSDSRPRAAGGRE